MSTEPWKQREEEKKQSPDKVLKKTDTDRRRELIAWQRGKYEPSFAPDYVDFLVWGQGGSFWSVGQVKLFLYMVSIVTVPPQPLHEAAQLEALGAD